MEIVKNIIDNRYTYAQYIAVPATVLSCLGFYQVMGNGTSVIWALMLILGLFLSLCAYCLGGLLKAIKSSLSIAKWGCESDGYVKKECSCGDLQTETIPTAGHNWEHFHQDQVTHRESWLACHCGGWIWNSADGDGYIDSFAAHINSVEDWWNHSYYNDSKTVVDVPSVDYDVCTVCGVTK